MIQKHIENTSEPSERLNPLRECFIVIEKNFAALCLSWLKRPRPTQQSRQNAIPALQNVLAGVVGPVPVNAASPVLAPPIVKRRSSIASCRNIFEVDGAVDEVGFDYLHHVQGESYEHEGVGNDQSQQSDNNGKNYIY